MKIAIYTLTAEEVKEQEQAIAKYEALIQKEISMGDLMNLENVQTYAKAIKKHSSLINNGITYDNEFMINQLEGQPNVQILEA